MRDLIKLIENFIDDLDGGEVEDTEDFIAGYDVCVEPNEDREGVNCWISKDGYSASLAAAEGEGVLVNGRDQEIPISERSLDAIRKWAEARGY